MGKAADIQELLKEAVNHIETGKDFITLLTAVMNQVKDNVPPEDVAKLVASIGGWLGTSLKPIDTAWEDMYSRSPSSRKPRSARASPKRQRST